MRAVHSVSKCDMISVMSAVVWSMINVAIWLRCSIVTFFNFLIFITRGAADGSCDSDVTWGSCGGGAVNFDCAFTGGGLEGFVVVLPSRGLAAVFASFRLEGVAFASFGLEGVLASLGLEVALASRGLDGLFASLGLASLGLDGLLANLGLDGLLDNLGMADFDSLGVEGALPCLGLAERLVNFGLEELVSFGFDGDDFAAFGWVDSLTAEVCGVFCFGGLWCDGSFVERDKRPGFASTGSFDDSLITFSLLLYSARSRSSFDRHFEKHFVLNRPR